MTPISWSPISLDHVGARAEVVGGELSQLVGAACDLPERGEFGSDAVPRSEQIVQLCDHEGRYDEHIAFIDNEPGDRLVARLVTMQRSE